MTSDNSGGKSCQTDRQENAANLVMKEKELSKRGQDLMDRLAKGETLDFQDVVELLQELGEG